MTAGPHFRYSRWDGTQVGFELDAGDVFSEITDDLLYHGDLEAALRRLLQQGFRDRNGEQIEGLRELMEQLRDQRRELLENHDLGGVYDDIAGELREVVDQERAALDDLAREAEESGDARRKELTDEVVAERQMHLDLLSPDLAGMVKDLQEYDFTSEGARERFEELLDKLRQQLMQRQVNQMAGAMENMSPADIARMKDMMAELNRMLDQRANGEEPDFAQFMENFGDLFPENPQSLDELLEVMAQRMAAMQAMLNSMTPEQRAQLQALSDQLLEDLDLRWQVDQLGEHLRSLFPQMGWERSYDFSGQDPLDFADAAGLFDQLGDIDQLENLLRGAANPGALAEVDIDRARELLGDDAARSLDRLADLAKMLEEAGLIEQREGRLELTPRAIRAIGNKALSDLYRKLVKDRPGKHQIQRSGVGNEQSYEHKPYEFGDPFHLNVQETVKNAIWRSGAGTPVRLLPDDFEVERTEQTTRSATVLLLDVSLSMPMRDNFLPAKKVAMALHALITSQFPRDYFGLVSFGRVARDVKPELLPEMSWDFEWGTNMQHALLLARKQLSRQTGTKQIIMVTDGEPTAHIENGQALFSYPPSHVTIEETLKEVMRCTRDGIRINTFMLDESYYLRSFVEQMMRINRGRAFFTTPDTLGDYVLVDFLDHRRKGRRAS